MTESVQSVGGVDLDGKVAIVTGASRGIGRGITEVFARAGASTVLVARTKSALDEVADGITRAGGSCETIVADVTRSEDMTRVAEDTLARHGRIDVLCHCVGIYPATPLEDLGLEEWDEVLRTNLTGTFLAVKACLPAMKEQHYGRIVLVSSITGARVGYRGLSHYASTKAGMIGFMRTAAVELAADGITINAVEPGSIRTEALKGLGQDAIATMKRIIPLGMLGEPEDVGYAALFLASDAARFITGQSIVVDGGQILPEIPL
jgi:3-oxoacyl-[acyl-carrier protein] reductase